MAKEENKQEELELTPDQQKITNKLFKMDELDPAELA